MNPLVTIYIPTRNRLNLLKRAVNSIIGQTFRDIELVVVSDGSEDDSDYFVNNIDVDFPVRLISNVRSIGACNARNQAIEEAKGKFVTGLDDDDWFRSDRIDLFVGRWKYFTAEGSLFSALCDSSVLIRSTGMYTWDRLPQVDINQIRRENAIGSQIFTFRHRYIDCGLFDPDIPAWQDWDLWMRIINKYGPVLNLQRETYFLDQSHQKQRISTSDCVTIRRAYKLFVDKHGYRKIGETANLLVSYLRYPQAKVNLIELMILVMAFKVRKAIHCIIRRRISWVFN